MKVTSGQQAANTLLTGRFPVKTKVTPSALTVPSRGMRCIPVSSSSVNVTLSGISTTPSH